ncbi:transmembrane amino acid transporter protein-domain-containing protein [Aspergillus pseudonomiae]|uniref:Transmembrane amino acid transporter protein-domain-containing protein n=1 Tax=Aspergillus pseudonomiae TaxID=1506151 RepID=A0A5N6I2L0_9EURO|nr:transmembrane amino acid transporter protein-domain-containing protein [Aspergillus pseudonomiae]KAB8260955.1 transmembrane amino acid transporter protein-domain-containing protein [Aspergillus pseudonomiae]KAE8404852.1 transmembrane amino acid transporter protein-domain-containing protein [Aspergillus pseudonomiae]
MAPSPDQHGSTVLSDTSQDAEYDVTFKDTEKQQEEKARPEYQDTFGDEEYAEVKYKVLSWCLLTGFIQAMWFSDGRGNGLAGDSLVTRRGCCLRPCPFRWRYPHIQSMADAGEVLLGKFGREFLGTGQLLLIIFIMASHILTFTVAMNSITDHGTCSIVFGVVGLVISYVLCLPRTSAKVSYLSIASFISVFSAVMIVMIALGIQRPWHGGVQATVDTSLYKAFLAVCNIVFSFSGHVAFFGFMSELKDPKDYPKSLFLLQGIDVILYIVTAVVIYYYAGQDVTSPALGSASPVVRKVAYGIALPTIIIGGVVNGHVACKYVYVRLFRGSDRMHKKDLVATGSWIILMLLLWVVAWVIAEAIPVFNNLLSLVVRPFGYSAFLQYGLSATFWLYLNKDRLFATPMKIFLTILNVLIFAIAGCICGLGLYVSGKALHDDPSSASFSCANNA